jgi:hypothetical protein
MDTCNKYTVTFLIEFKINKYLDNFVKNLMVLRH